MTMIKVKVLARYKKRQRLVFDYIDCSFCVTQKKNNNNNK